MVTSEQEQEEWEKRGFPVSLERVMSIMFPKESEQETRTADDQSLIGVGVLLVGGLLCTLLLLGKTYSFLSGRNSQKRNDRQRIQSCSSQTRNSQSGDCLRQSDLRETSYPSPSESQTTSVFQSRTGHQFDLDVVESPSGISIIGVRDNKIVWG